MFSPALTFAAVTATQLGLGEIVARHIDAMGGETRLAQVQSYVVDGWYREKDFLLDHTYTAQMRPFYRVIGAPSHELDDIHEGYDGSAWEYYPDPGIVVRTVGQAARATRRAAVFIDPIVDRVASGVSLAYAGVQAYYGHTVYVLHETFPDSYREDLFVDTTSFMIDGRAETVPMHAFGHRYKVHDLYEDYRTEGGVPWPHRDREVDAETGQILDEGGIHKVDINPSLSLASFSPPQWDRTPLQRMIQQIYDERDEAGSAVATYRAFSALVNERTAAASDAVDFVGYQCLKMGHADTAVALLALNVASYPASARAHFGYGRALQAAGNRAMARVEYQRALAIDPKYDRARAALKALGNNR
jgi:tetratricopeptide (TPR) repeat protein